MLPRESTARHSGDGFLLVDLAARPIYANQQAMEILAYPNHPRHLNSVRRLIHKKIQSILSSQDLSEKPTFDASMISGRREYECHGFCMDTSLSGSSRIAVALLFERRFHTSADLAHVVSEFHLTMREQAVVELLLRGLTSKEIAKRLAISPNTVKAFLRFVMIKLGVSTRAGIVSKLLGAMN